MSSVRIRPSKSVSVAGMIAGILFVGIGLLVIIPIFGPFGFVWTGIAAAITIFHAVNVFSQRGIATTVIDVDERDSHRPIDGNESSEGSLQFDERLRRLEGLRADKLITEEEYQQKRQDVMRTRW